jgi:hypothetical protein
LRFLESYWRKITVWPSKYIFWILQNSSFLLCGSLQCNYSPNRLKLTQKNVSRIRKKTFYLQFCMGTPEGNEFAGWIQNPKILEHQINQSKRKIFQKKDVWYLKSVKEPNIRMEATRRNLRARLKILKKISDCQINKSKRKFSQKKYV